MDQRSSYLFSLSLSHSLFYPLFISLIRIAFSFLSPSKILLFYSPFHYSFLVLSPLLALSFSLSLSCHEILSTRVQTLVNGTQNRTFFPVPCLQVLVLQVLHPTHSLSLSLPLTSTTYHFKLLSLTPSEPFSSRHPQFDIRALKVTFHISGFHTLQTQSPKERGRENLERKRERT